MHPVFFYYSMQASSHGVFHTDDRSTVGFFGHGQNGHPMTPKTLGWMECVPSGKLTQLWLITTFQMGKSTISTDPCSIAFSMFTRGKIPYHPIFYHHAIHHHFPSKSQFFLWFTTIFHVKPMDIATGETLIYSHTMGLCSYFSVCIVIYIYTYIYTNIDVGIHIYSLVNIQKTIENGPVEIVSCPTKLVMFHRFFVCLPEGTYKYYDIVLDESPTGHVLKVVCFLHQFPLANRGHIPRVSWTKSCWQKMVWQSTNGHPVIWKLVDFLLRKKHRLVAGFNPSEKYEFMSWDDDIPNWIESHKIPWFQTTNQITIIFPFFVGL